MIETKKVTAGTFQVWINHRRSLVLLEAREDGPGYPSRIALSKEEVQSLIKRLRGEKKKIKKNISS